MERKRFESKKSWHAQEQEIREQMEKGRGGNKVIGGRERQRRAVKVGSSGVFGRLHLSKVWVGASADERTTMTLWALSELDPCDQAQLSTMLIPFYLSAFHPAHISRCTFSRPCSYTLVSSVLFFPPSFIPFPHFFLLLSHLFVILCIIAAHLSLIFVYFTGHSWAHTILVRGKQAPEAAFMYEVYFSSPHRHVFSLLINVFAFISCCGQVSYESYCVFPPWFLIMYPWKDYLKA